MKTRSKNAYSEYAANDLLAAALFALNSIPNWRLDHSDYRMTYNLAAAIEKHLRATRGAP